MSALVIAVLACAPVADPQVPAGGVPVENADQVFQSSYSGFQSRQRLVIRDAEAWDQFWSQAHERVSPQPAVPSIDFSSNIVVAATMGSRSTGGYSIDVEGVYDANDAVYAVLRERSPGRNCITTQALTQPVVAVRIPRVGASVSFIERTEISNC